MSQNPKSLPKVPTLRAERIGSVGLALLAAKVKKP